MGSNKERDFAPQHEVTLDSYYICKHEVTWELWDAVMNYMEAEYYGYNKDIALSGPSWEYCQEFIGKLNEMTGSVFSRRVMDRAAGCSCFVWLPSGGWCSGCLCGRRRYAARKVGFRD